MDPIGVDSKDPMEVLGPSLLPVLTLLLLKLFWSLEANPLLPSEFLLIDLGSDFFSRSMLFLNQELILSPNFLLGDCLLTVTTVPVSEDWVLVLTRDSIMSSSTGGCCPDGPDSVLEQIVNFGTN